MNHVEARGRKDERNQAARITFDDFESSERVLLGAVLHFPRILFSPLEGHVPGEGMTAAVFDGEPASSAANFEFERACVISEDGGPDGRSSQRSDFLPGFFGSEGNARHRLARGSNHTSGRLGTPF